MPNDVPPRLDEGDRDAALTRLKEAFAGGHISHAEMDEHLQSTLEATTHADLAPVLASLPEPSSGRTVTLSGMSGRFRRRGTWRVPQVLKIESEYGRADLDLTRAIIEDSTVTIELGLRFGGARVTVPVDAVVDLDDMRTIWKQPVYKAPERPGSGGPRIRITGTMEYGRLKVRHKRKAP